MTQTRLSPSVASASASATQEGGPGVTSLKPEVTGRPQTQMAGANGSPAAHTLSSPSPTASAGFPADLFRCPETRGPLRYEAPTPADQQTAARRGDQRPVEGVYVSAETGKRWPVIGGIPRFVESDLYVDSFSFEWNTHNQTQLDSKTGSTASEEMFKTKTGLDADQVRGRLVLDAGVGAGRFSDVLSRWGANVVGVDLSYAVEASYANFRHLPNVKIAQADIGRLPFAEGTFDYIVSIGVLHHTPNLREYFNRLVPLLKPGGEICIWVYPAQGDYIKRAAWIPFTYRIPDRWFYGWCRVFVPWALRHMNNPVVQYIHRAFPFSNQGLGVENDILDTFDGYSPRYHEIHNPDEVVTWFNEAGLIDVRTLPWDTAVRGRCPGG